MKDITQLVDQHILEYESRQQHINELLARARERTGEGSEHADVRSQLDKLEKERDRLSNQLDQLKCKNPNDWQQEELTKEGPLAIWDVLAQDIEKLLEKL
jgi:hypothetical protein